MKLLIVVGLFPLISADPTFYPGFPFVPPGLFGQKNAPRKNNFRSNSDIRSLSRELVSTLRKLGNEPRAARAIEKLFSDNNSVCLRSLDEAIEAIQEGTRLVEAAEGDIRTLNSRVESLMGLRDEAEVVREVASILRALQPLLTKISPTNPTSKICRVSTDRTLAYLRSLAVLLHQLSEEAQQDPEERALLARAASTVSAVTAFLGQLRLQVREFQSLCQPDRESIQASIRALGNIIASLADMTAVVGNHRAAEDIRKGNLVTEKIMGQIQTMKDLDLGYDSCSGRQDLASAADNMEDLANIIEDVGMDNLRKQLGFNVAFDFQF